MKVEERFEKNWMDRSPTATNQHLSAKPLQKCLMQTCNCTVRQCSQLLSSTSVPKSQIALSSAAFRSR